MRYDEAIICEGCAGPIQVQLGTGGGQVLLVARCRSCANPGVFTVHLEEYVSQQTAPKHIVSESQCTECGAWQTLHINDGHDPRCPVCGDYDAADLIDGN
jgi:rubrerythrin